MRTAWRGSIVAALTAGFAATSFACGYCIEDKIAAVYDHAVVTRTPFAGMERSLSRKLVARGLSVAILRVMDQPAELKPAGKR